MTKEKNSILIVDDESSNIMALTHILSPDYIVYAAKNGHTALEAADKHLPDIILLDIMMPEMNGYEVLAVLKESEKTQHIPIIFVTGLNNDGDEEKGLALGASDYIIKPFSAVIVKLRVHNQMKVINQTRLVIEKELAEQSSRARIDFLLRASHEMLTPMNAIMGIVQMLKMSEVSGRTREYLGEMDTATRRLMELINNLLAASDKGTGTFVLTDSVFSFTTMLQSILNEINQNAAKKLQRLTCDIDSSIPARLVGDNERLMQVITNLLTNAVKFTPDEGYVQFSVRVIEDAVIEGTSETITLQFEVTDSGIGMSKEQQNGIFNIFTQADESLTRKYEGIGLGLPISKRIVEMMGGEMWVESEPDKGAKFAFTCKMRKG